MEDGLDILIAQLQSLKGAAFWQQLVAITKRKEFKEIEPGMERLQDAARKARSFGYQVYILPNPKGFRSADYIFKYKNSYKLYELKTIHGRNSVGNRLSEASKQSNRVLLNFGIRYNPRLLAVEIAKLFQENKETQEVLVFYKRRKLSITKVSNTTILWRNLLKIK